MGLDLRVYTKCDKCDSKLKEYECRWNGAREELAEKAGIEIKCGAATKITPEQLAKVITLREIDELKAIHFDGRVFAREIFIEADW
jgi:hypothetical protein